MEMTSVEKMMSALRAETSALPKKREQVEQDAIDGEKREAERARQGIYG